MAAPRPPGARPSAFAGREARFTHHHAWDPARHILPLRFPLMHVACERRTELLGEDAWLTEAVDKLTPPHCHRETTALRPAERTPDDLCRTTRRFLPHHPGRQSAPFGGRGRVLTNS